MLKVHCEVAKVCWRWSTEFKISAIVYQVMSVQLVLPSVDGLYGEPGFISQLNLETAFTAKSTNPCFSDHVFTVCEQTENWPDLNPREDLWGQEIEPPKPIMQKS